uniref:Sialidase domain-containing protein n=1 Tax=viral metagenome TaxID=1070528 RepID=A0A6C0EAI2_9ZZZZ
MKNNLQKTIMKTYWSKEYNWRRASVSRYLQTPDDNCVINNETYFKPPNINNHSSNLYYDVKKNILCCCWFSGDNEGDEGCHIYISRFDLNNKMMMWSDPIKITDNKGFADQNPIMFYFKDYYYMIHNTQVDKVGDTSAYIKLVKSVTNDFSAKEIQSCEFDNKRGQMIRCRVLVEDDRVLLPFYFIEYNNTEAYFKSGLYIIRSLDKVIEYQKVIIEGSENLLEPCLVRVGNDCNGIKYHLYFRDQRAKYVYRSISMDGGVTWDKPEVLVLENNHSAIDVIRASNGKLVLVGNRKFDKRNFGRAPLSIYVSDDDGVNWKFIMDLDPKESEPYYVWRYGEFSYPSILEIGDYFHISYTYNRKTIKYIKILIRNILEKID